MNYNNNNLNIIIEDLNQEILNKTVLDNFKKVEDKLKKISILNSKNYNDCKDEKASQIKDNNLNNELKDDSLFGDSIKRHLINKIQSKIKEQSNLIQTPQK